MEQFRTIPRKYLLLYLLKKYKNIIYVCKITVLSLFQLSFHLTLFGHLLTAFLLWTLSRCFFFFCFFVALPSLFVICCRVFCCIFVIFCQYLFAYSLIYYLFNNTLWVKSFIWVAAHYYAVMVGLDTIAVENHRFPGF